MRAIILAAMAVVLYANGANAATRNSPDEFKPGGPLKLTVGASAVSASAPGVVALDEELVPLDNGIPVSNLAAASGESLYFSLVVPDGAATLIFEMGGGTGDADLYVQYGEMPTDSEYDCRPFSSGNEESCEYELPEAGTYYVRVKGYTDFSGVTLVGSYTGGGGSGGDCPAGYELSEGELSEDSPAIVFPAYTARRGVHSGLLSGPDDADFDLYLQMHKGRSWVTAASSLSLSSEEEVDYSGRSGAYRWRVSAYSGTGSFSLCTMTP